MGEHLPAMYKALGSLSNMVHTQKAFPSLGWRAELIFIHPDPFSVQFYSWLAEQVSVPGEQVSQLQILPL